MAEDKIMSNKAASNAISFCQAFFKVSGGQGGGTNWVCKVGKECIFKQNSYCIVAHVFIKPVSPDCGKEVEIVAKALPPDLSFGVVIKFCPTWGASLDIEGFHQRSIKVFRSFVSQDFHNH